MQRTFRDFKDANVSVRSVDSILVLWRPRGDHPGRSPLYPVLFIIYKTSYHPTLYSLDQWYSTFFVRVPPDIISLQLCTPKVVGV
jgi:hypothetical protein